MNNVLFKSVVFVCLLISCPAFAGEPKSAKTVAGTLTVGDPKKKTETSDAIKLINIKLNGKIIKTVRGLYPEIMKVFTSKELTIAIIKYGTGGNHCQADDYLVIGLNSKKQYLLLDNVSFCNIHDFTTKTDNGSLRLIWRDSATSTKSIIYKKNNDYRFSEEVNDLKTFTTKDYDNIYYIYKEMCHYDENTPSDINQYNMQPAGYYADTYKYYADMLEFGPFKAICHEAAFNKDYKQLTKKQLINKLVE